MSQVVLLRWNSNVCTRGFKGHEISRHDREQNIPMTVKASCYVIGRGQGVQAETLEETCNHTRTHAPAHKVDLLRSWILTALLRTDRFWDTLTEKN